MVWLERYQSRLWRLSATVQRDFLSTSSATVNGTFRCPNALRNERNIIMMPGVLTRIVLHCLDFASLAEVGWFRKGWCKSCISCSGCGRFHRGSPISYFRQSYLATLATSNHRLHRPLRHLVYSLYRINSSRSALSRRRCN